MWLLLAVVGPSLEHRRVGRSCAWRRGLGASATRWPRGRTSGPSGCEQGVTTGQRGQPGRLQRWAVDLASEHRHLMAQHDDLDREVRVLATGEPDQLEHATERPVQQREGHRRMLAASGADVKVQITAHGWRSRHPQGPPYECGSLMITSGNLERQEPPARTDGGASCEGSSQARPVRYGGGGGTEEPPADV